MPGEPFGIAAGPASTLWITEISADKIARFTVSVPCLLTKNGQLASFSAVSENTSPSSVTSPLSSSAMAAS